MGGIRGGEGSGGVNTKDDRGALLLRDLNAARKQNKRLAKALRALVADVEQTARNSYRRDAFEQDFEEAEPEGYAAWKEACAALKQAEEGG